jgi:hypothetical protein
MTAKKSALAKASTKKAAAKPAAKKKAAPKSKGKRPTKPITVAPEVIDAARKEVRTLPVFLTQEEKSVRGSKLAELTMKIASIETDKKSAMADFTKKRKEAEKERDAVARVLNEEKEYREVAVAIVNADNGLNKQIVRVDTGEVVETRPATEDERQATLFETDGASGDAGTGEGLADGSLPPDGGEED